ncbi:O-methyltransferase [Streptomyces sp. NPDC055056]
MTPVSILAAVLDDMVRRLDAEPGLTHDPTFAAGLRWARELAGGLDPYLERCTTPESPALRRLAERTRSVRWDDASGSEDPAFGTAGRRLEAEMLSGHVEGQFLKTLLRASGARQVLEIGMFTGYSALAMAEELPAEGRVVACEIDEHVAAFARRCFAESPSGDRIDVRVGPALDTLRQLASDGCPFDLIFIDADKPGYGDYLTAILDGGLLAPRGLVCVDNTLMQGAPWTSAEPTPNGVAIGAFNEQVAADPRVEQVLLPLRDGLTLIRLKELS